MRSKHGITLEHLRVTAIRGKILDSDGSLLLDLFSAFGVEEKVVDFALGTLGTDVGGKCDEVVGYNDNLVINNRISGMRCYGIMFYRIDQNISDKSVSDNLAIGNRIKDIKGDIINTVNNTYAFGCGIYVQGAENSVVNGNIISRSHSGEVTFAETLAPGAIGITNVTRVTVTGNDISDAGHAGIWISEGNNLGSATGFTLVTGNTITGTVSNGIRINERGRVRVIGNTLDTTRGIRVSNTSLLPDISINDNTIRNSISGTTSAIQVAFVRGMSVNDNTVDVAPVHGIVIDNCDVVSANDNTIIAHTVRAIQITATCTQVQAFNNNIKGLNSAGASAAEGMRIDCPARYGNNTITGCTTPFAGAFAPWRDLTANSNTPSVADGSEFSFNNTAATTVTQLADGYDGQEIWIRAKDANTTLKFAASNLKGNGGVDRLLKAGDFVNAKYHRALGAWAVSIIAAA